jgi:hypothetical protein
MSDKRHGVSYAKRVLDVNRIYDDHVKSGLSNREIWRRYIYPRYGISERTFYHLLTAPAMKKIEIPKETERFLEFADE